MKRQHESLIRILIVLALVPGTLTCASASRKVADTGTFSFAIIGDAGRWNANTKSVQKSISDDGIRNLILPGDNLYDERKQTSSYADIWSHWPGFNFEVVAIGNHYKSYSEEEQYFKMPGEYFSKVVDKDIRFEVLNSDDDDKGQEQADWLDRDLKHASEKFIFLVYHHPTYNVCIYHKWQQKEKFQTALRTVIWKNRDKITGIIVGHEHVAALLTFNDLPVIVSGAAMETIPYIADDYSEGEVHVKTQWNYEKVPYWTRLDLNTGTAEATVSFVRAKDSHVSCTAKISGKNLELGDNCKSSAKQ